MSLLVSKVSSLVVLAVTTTIAAMFPLKLYKPSTKSDKKSSNVAQNREAEDRILKPILAFSGGVLLSTVFIHMMPDIDDEFEKALSPSGNGSVMVTESDVEVSSRSISALFIAKMPWGQFVVCMGFFIIYAVEEIVEYCINKTQEERPMYHNHHDSTRTLQLDASTMTSDEDSIENLSARHKNLEKSSTCQSAVHGAHREPHKQQNCDHHHTLEETAIGFDDVDLDEKTPLFQIPAKSKTNYREPRSRTFSCSTTLESSCEIMSTEEKHQHCHEKKGKRGRKKDQSVDIELTKLQLVRNTMRGIVLIIALSFHSIFEGMAIGLQFTVGGVWTSLIAVALHKLVMAFCAGVELVHLSNNGPVYYVTMVAFSLVCPFGIAIGTTVTEIYGSAQSADDSSVSIATLQGFACGTLMYVTFFEVLTRARGKNLTSFFNFAAVLAGFSLITVLHLLD